MTEPAIDNTVRIYRCAKGHSVIIRSGTWTALNLQFTDPNAKGPRVNRSFNYCMECYGEWAEAQWPLTCQEIKPVDAE